MESTGVYWKPVWNLLEGQFEVLLVNAQHIKAVPGRKTDQKDKLLVIAYYILRDGTRYNDLGADYFDRLNPEGLRRRLTKRLEGLGFKVTLEPLAQVA
jgi:transposase